MNPAPDAELTSVGQANFDWIVEQTADLAIAKAQAAPLPPELRWSAFLSVAPAPTKKTKKKPAPKKSIAKSPNSLPLSLRDSLRSGSLTAGYSTKPGCPRSRFWDLGKQVPSVNIGPTAGGWVPHPCDVVVLVARVGDHRAHCALIAVIPDKSRGAPGLAFETWDSTNPRYKINGSKTYSETRVGVSRKHYTKVDATIRERRPCTKFIGPQ